MPKYFSMFLMYIDLLGGLPAWVILFISKPKTIAATRSKDILFLLGFRKKNDGLPMMR
jgi:hypothetical protein